MATLGPSREKELIDEINNLLKKLPSKSLKHIAKRLCEQLHAAPDTLFEDAQKSIFAAISQTRENHALYLLELDSSINWVWLLFQFAEDSGFLKNPESMDTIMGRIRAFLNDHNEEGLFYLLIEKEQWKHEPGSQPVLELDKESNGLLQEVQQAPAIMRLGVLEALCEIVTTQDTATITGIKQQLPNAWALADRWLAVVTAFPILALNYDWEYLLEFIRNNEWDYMDTWAKEIQALETIIEFRKMDITPDQLKLINERTEFIVSIVRDLTLSIDMTPKAATNVCHAAISLKAEDFERYYNKITWLTINDHPKPAALEAQPGLIDDFLLMLLTGTAEDYEPWIRNFPVRGSMTAHEIDHERQQYAKDIIACQNSIRLILLHHEESIIRKWDNARSGARKDWLETSWKESALDGDPKKVYPMNPYHSPDVTYVLLDAAEKLGPEPGALEWRWPLINIEDLVNKERGLMMIMLHARGYNPPYLFTNADFQSITIGRQRRKLPEGQNTEWWMEFFGSTTAEGYGKLTRDWSVHDVWRTLPISDGLLVLEVQARLYRFLKRFCMAVLRMTEAQAVHLTTLESPAAPDIPPAHIAKGLADPTYYRLPGRLQDIDEVQELVRSQTFSARLHFRMLHGDPTYFAKVFQNIVDHRQEQIQVLTTSNGQLTLKPDEALKTKAFPSKVLGTLLYDSWYSIVMWENIHTKLLSLQHEIKSHGELLHTPLHGRALPNLSEGLLCAFLSLRDQLEVMIREQLQRLVDLLRASPPLRDAFCQQHKNTTPGPLDGDYFVYLRTGEGDFGDRAAPDGCLPLWEHLFASLGFFHGQRHDVKTNTPIEVQLDIHQQVQFIHELQGRISKDTKQSQSRYISPYIQETLPELFLLADCWQQIHRYQPWAGNRIHTFGRLATLDPRAQGMPYRFGEFCPAIAVAANTKTLSDLAKPFYPGTFSYPDPRVKKNTAENIAQCKKIERALDDLWKRVPQSLGATILKTPECLQVEIRSAVTTSIWKKSPIWAAVGFKVHSWRQNPKASKEITKLQQAEETARREQVEAAAQAEETAKLEQAKIEAPPREPPRGKKRGSTEAAEPARKLIKATPAVPAPEEPDVALADTIPLSSRAMKAVDMLFFQPKARRGRSELYWEEFIAFMRDVGFTQAAAGGGSANTFTPPDSLGGHAITIHHPHPQKYWPLGKARQIGRRLTAQYHLTASSFRARN
ncbi:hypothetical protein N7494_001469 [Penicillium frequentans]|uniref:Uncharacterized protein n=1 Tax=Penicillium frequentans TaxID=3151616 RepID=A0AAD6D1T4_9EURO|nr:hypothetical protein N7494_001469 [Penicillium glabrum]